MLKSSFFIKLIFLALVQLFFLSGCGKPPVSVPTEVPVKSVEIIEAESPKAEEIIPTDAAKHLQEPKQDMQKPFPTIEKPPSESKATQPALPEAPVSPEKLKEAEEIYNNGFNIYMSGKYDSAIKEFNRAIKIDPLSYKAYNCKGIALCFLGNYKEGMPLIKKALEIKPDFPYSNFNMALAYKLQRDYDNALIWFGKTVAYNPKDVWSYYGIATIYADRKDTLKALEYLKKAIELDSTPGVKDTVKSQSHWDGLRNNPEFINLIK